MALAPRSNLGGTCVRLAPPRLAVCARSPTTRTFTPVQRSSALSRRRRLASISCSSAWVSCVRGVALDASPTCAGGRVGRVGEVGRVSQA
eukprot:XP_001690190.1 predicted protein [Chlamydomonas reinhardtii]